MSRPSAIERRASRPDRGTSASPVSTCPAANAALAEAPRHGSRNYCAADACCFGAGGSKMRVTKKE